MSLPALPDDTAVLDAAHDPGQLVVAMLDRAKSWLAQAQTTDLPDVVDAKAKAEAIRVYTVQKELGHDAELSAAEIVRRAERRIGELIREGQAEGTIRRKGEAGAQGDYIRGGRVVRGGRDAHGENKTSPSKFLRNTAEVVATYAVTDGVSREEFEDALTEAKAEQNLSRANVVRKAKEKSGKTAAEVGSKVAKAKNLAADGYTSRQIGDAIGVKDMAGFRRRHGIDVPADAAVGKTHRHDANRIVGESVAMLAGIVHGLDLVGDPRDADLDHDQIADWATSLSDSLRLLNRFSKQIKEMTQ